MTILARWPDTKDEIPLCIREYSFYRDEHKVHNGVTFRETRVIISIVLPPEILTRIYASHLGAETCLRKARDVIYWPAMNSEVKDFIRNCNACNGYLQNNSKELQISHPISSRPGNRIAMDIMTVFDRNYLITVDFCSKFWGLDTLPNNPTAASVIRCCKRNLSRHGIPDVVVADTGRQFDCKVFEQFAKEWEFECNPSDPYHSQSNGEAEPALKIAKKLTKKTEQDVYDLWKAILD